MAGDIRTRFGSDCALTITLASLAHSDNFIARQSSAVDNDLSCALDVLVTVRCHVGTVGAPNVIRVYAYGSHVAPTAGARQYTGKASGSDAAFGAAGSECIRLLPLIGVIPAYTNSMKLEGGPFSIAAAFGGVVPPKWGIVVQNNSGAALDATTVDNCAKYMVVYGEYTT